MSAKIVKDELTPEGKQFMQMITELDGKQVRVGFQRGDAADDNGVDMVDIAAWNELGTSHAPSRPFLRKSVDDNHSRITSFFRGQIKRMMLENASADEILKQIGIFQKGLIQKTILDGDFEPNAPSTIARKGSSKPLIDTGRMMQSVNFVIKAKGDDD